MNTLGFSNYLLILEKDYEYYIQLTIIHDQVISEYFGNTMTYLKGYSLH